MNVLVVAAHPDDETLGCGGTIAKHIQSGDDVSVLIMGKGRSLEAMRECSQACIVLGVNRLSFKDFPDNQMDHSTILAVATEIEAEMKEFEPKIVYTHSTSDMNVDHRMTAEATFVACRPMSGVKRILSFEILSSTEWGMSFKPNWFEDITSTVHLKLVAMKEYQSELRDYPHPRSLMGIEHLAALRGTTVNVPAAEAFVLHRMIQ